MGAKLLLQMRNQVKQLLAWNYTVNADLKKGKGSILQEAEMTPQT